MAFRLLVVLVIVSYIVHRAYYVRKVRHGSGTVAHQPPEPGLRFLLLLLAVALAGTTAYVARPEWMRWASMPLPGWLRWAGLVPAAAGFALLQWSQVALGRNWSGQVQLLTDHELVVSGPYRWVRHPMYTAGLLTHVSLPLLSANWFVGGIWLLLHGSNFAARIPLEERLMTSQFGDAYGRYKRTTGRLLPRVLHRG